MIPQDLKGGELRRIALGLRKINSGTQSMWSIRKGDSCDLICVSDFPVRYVGSKSCLNKVKRERKNKLVGTGAIKNLKKELDTILYIQTWLTAIVSVGFC